MVGRSSLRSQIHHPKGCLHWELFSIGYSVLHAEKGHSHAGHIHYPALQLRHRHGVTFCTAGFIDFIVEPTFSVLTDVAEKSVQPLVDDDSKSKNQPR